MTILKMLLQSLILTGLGMGVVFAFLIIMIVCMNLLRIFIHACHLDKDLYKNDEVKNNDIDENAIVAAISVAIHENQ